MAGTKNLRDATLIIQDGSSPTKKTLTIPIMDGNLTYTVTDPSFTVRNRGKIVTRKKGDETEIDVSFSFKFNQWQYDSGASTGLSVVDVLRGQAPAVAASWVTTDATSNCAPWAIDLVYRLFDTCDQDGDYEQLILEKFHAETTKFTEGNEASMIEVTGKCLSFEPVRSFVVV